MKTNVKSNKIQHQRQADCIDWLRGESRRGGRRYGLIFLDPPTFSSSKRMAHPFDIQRDHVGLIRAAAALLAPEGILIFSCNFRRFRMDETALEGLVVEEITPGTIPRDFSRNPKIHRCWRITRVNGRHKPSGRRRKTAIRGRKSGLHGR